MLRLLLAACTAYILLPTNLEPRQLAGETETVTTFEALTAADAIVRDISGVCERNAEACKTGISLLNNAKHTVLTMIGQGSEETADDKGPQDNASPSAAE